MSEFAFITMSWQEDFRWNAVMNCMDQLLPAEDKHLYLLYQRPFPARLDHDLPIRISEINVRGEWPKLWALKLAAFLEDVEEPFTVWWDEDDMFEPDYVAKAVTPILSGEADLTCNMMNINVKKGIFEYAPMSVGSGTLVIRTELLRTLFNQLIAKHPSLVWSKDTKPGHMPDPLDGPFYYHIWMKHPRLRYHDALRYYFWQRLACCSGHRKAGVAVDA